LEKEKESQAPSNLGMKTGNVKIAKASKRKEPCSKISNADVAIKKPKKLAANNGSSWMSPLND